VIIFTGLLNVISGLFLFLFVYYYITKISCRNFWQ